ncbi:ecdysteroid 22-kinase family protein [Novosphingobium sp. FKTRR1]|uniref:ecdysteroid 22-kinase family protein n=1 Tax=Novosphingobium sp. FKTRR1 TaxID=2879118 RepID=UPI001CEFEDC0|nr:ecdysteroid 22-kinase family protein [Novosphingobium sp. FKTRR1]
MADFPTTPAAVEARWLEAKLRDAGLLGDAHITDISWVAIGTGQVGDTARFTIRYDRDGAGPATVAAKFASSDPTSRGTAAMFGLYRKEVSFYRELAPLIDTRTPRTYAGEVSEDGSDFVLLFEDLGPCQGGNQLAGCTIEEARHGVMQAAALHAPTYCNPVYTQAAWPQGVEGIGVRMAELYPKAQAIFRERYDGLLEPELMQVCEDLNALIAPYYLREPREVSITHGDFRLDNMLFDVCGGTDPVAIVDWQTTVPDCPLKDIGYLLGCGIGSALRRPYEDELLDLYCAEMNRRGVPFTREGIWDRYRVGALHGVATAVFSAAFVVRTERGDANFLSMARNSCELCLDHDSIGALRHVLEIA